MDTKEAASAFKRGEFAAAAELYTSALAVAETAAARASALVSRAQCYVRLKEFSLGRDDAATARSLDPGNPKAWYRLGICESRLGCLAEAEAALTQAATLRPGDDAVADALAVVRRRHLEASGRYPLAEVYAHYLMKERGPVGGVSSPAAEEQPLSVLSFLGCEPFVGPVRVGFSEGRGRGLFVTEDVPAGTLLFCAQALVTGDGETLPGLLQDCVRRSSDLRDTVWKLSRGTRNSEVLMPTLDALQLAAPRRLIPQQQRQEEADEQDDTFELDELVLQTILYSNQFSLPIVNPNSAPIEVTNDFERSGVWLLPCFANHSCLPNVQRVIVKDCFFLRAGRDLKAGDELFECYIETLQPLAKRQSQLSSYNIVCRCERCVIEEAVLYEQDVEEVFQASAEAKYAGEAKDIAEAAEQAWMQAEVVVARSLEWALREDQVPASRHYPLPAAPLTAERMAMLREGMESFADAAEEESFARQEALHCLLLGSMANVLRAYAISLRGLNQYVDACAAWTRVLDALQQVIPCSELCSVVGSEMLSAKLYAFNLDARGLCRTVLRRALVQSHRSYGGGARAWRVLNSHVFAESVLDAAEEEWACLEGESGDLVDSSFDPASLRPVAAAVAQPRAQVGFEDLLKRKGQAQRARGSGAGAPVHNGSCGLSTNGKHSNGQPMEEPATGGYPSRPEAITLLAEGEASTLERAGGSCVAGPEQATSDGARSDSARAFEQAALPPVVALVPGSPVATERASPRAQDVTTSGARFEITESSDVELSLVVPLPGLASAAEASLEVSEREVRVRSLRDDVPISIDVPLPRCVDPDSSRAKWSRRAQQLTVRLRTPPRPSPE